MLRFASKPDEVFTTLVTRSLTEAIDLLEEDIAVKMINFVDSYFEIEFRKSFGKGITAVRAMRNQLRAILEAHKSPDVYMPTDLHFKLLDRVLSLFCSFYSDTATEEDPPVDLLWFKGKPIYNLDFGALLSFFFWDTDYDLEPELALRVREAQKNGDTRFDFSSEALNTAMNCSPDTKDLTLEKWPENPPKEWSDEDEGFNWFKEEGEED